MKKRIIMKLTVFTYLFLLSSFTVIAQNQLDKSDPDFSKKLNANSHITDIAANLYLGAWVWEGQGNRFEIVLKKGTLDLGTKFDMIFGWIKYMENGEVIENTLPFQPETNEFMISNMSDNKYRKNSSAVGGLNYDHIFELTLTDNYHDRVYIAEMTIDAKNNRKAIMRIRDYDREGLRHIKPGINLLTRNKTVYFPQEMILLKQH